MSSVRFSSKIIFPKWVCFLRIFFWVEREREKGYPPGEETKNHKQRRITHDNINSIWNLHREAGYVNNK